MSESLRTNDYPKDPALFSPEHQHEHGAEPAAAGGLLVGFRVSERDFMAYQHVAELLHEDGAIEEARVGAMLQYATNLFLLHYGEETDKREIELRKKRLREKGIGDIYDPSRKQRQQPQVDGIGGI